MSGGPNRCTARRTGWPATRWRRSACSSGRRPSRRSKAAAESSSSARQEAANALLKLLEEPPVGSLFLLTTVDARRLLPTIRSRAVSVRLNRLTDDDVRGFLTREPDPP